MNMPARPLNVPTIAVVFARLGPYHLARLRGAASVLGRAGVGLAAISVAGTDRTYAWDRVEDAGICPTHLLFPDQRYEDIPPALLARRMEECLDAIRPCAVALPGWVFPEALSGLEWCARTRTAAVLMSESSRHDHMRIWLREWFKRNRVRRFRSALVGGHWHYEYARQLGLPRAAIFTGYDAVDNDYFRAGADQARAEGEALRSRLRLPARYVLTSSRFVRVKNIDGLLKGYARYRAVSPEPRDLVICGDGEERDYLHRLARLLGIAGSVHWPGFVQYPELPNYYALADAFILASTTEPWGLVVNEAMASGLPVLVSDRCGCSADLVREGENGFTFAPDPEHIARALGRLPDAAGCRAMGQRSRALVEHFSPENFGRNLLEAARLALARDGREDLGLPGGLG